MPYSPATPLVRIATAADVPALAALRARWTRERDGQVDDPDFEQRFGAWYETEASRRITWLAEVAGGPVGMVNLALFERMPAPGRPSSRWGYLGNAFVLEAFRDRGVGRMLLEGLLGYADAAGLARVVLSPSPRSVPFYRRAGFEPADMLLARRARPAEAEPGREDRPCAPPQVLHAGGEVGVHPLEGGRTEVRQEIELGVPLAGTVRPSEVVDRHGLRADRAEVLDQALVEREQAAHVREDDDRGAGRLGSGGVPGQQVGAVRGGQDDPLAVRSWPGAGRSGWFSVHCEAHRWVSRVEREGGPSRPTSSPPAGLTTTAGAHPCRTSPVASPRHCGTDCGPDLSAD